MSSIQLISPCLWFDGQAEEAVKFYTSIFPNSRLLQKEYFTEAGHAVHGQAAGALWTVTFELAGQEYMALNGGPPFKFNEAVSFQVRCESQEEVDRYWELLTEGGDPAAQQCGWLKDKFGLSWQVFPQEMLALLTDPDIPARNRVFEALLTMKKIDLAALRQAHEG